MRLTSSSFCGVPSGLLRVPLDRAGVADDALDQLGKVADRLILARPHVDQRVGDIGCGHVLDEEHHGFGEVVDVQELTSRRAGSPQRHRRVGLPGHVVVARQPKLRLMELAQHRRQHVARVQVEVVAGPVEVRRHEGEVVGAELPVETAAELDAGDLRDGVRPVGLFERSRKKVLLA